MSSVSMTYSWYNESKAFNNNTYKWRKVGQAWKTEAIPDGMHDHEDLNNLIQRQEKWTPHVFPPYDVPSGHSDIGWL